MEVVNACRNMHITIVGETYVDDEKKFKDHNWQKLYTNIVDLCENGLIKLCIFEDTKDFPDRSDDLDDDFVDFSSAND